MSLLEAQLEQLTGLYRAQAGDAGELRASLAETLAALESANKEVAGAETSQADTEAVLRVRQAARTRPCKSRVSQEHVSQEYVSTPPRKWQALRRRRRSPRRCSR